MKGGRIVAERQATDHEMKDQAEKRRTREEDDTISYLDLPYDAFVAYLERREEDRTKNMYPACTQQSSRAEVYRQMDYWAERGRQKAERKRHDEAPETEAGQLNHTVVYENQWAVAWNMEPPPGRPHPQLSVKNMREVIDINLKQMREAVAEGKEPRQKWLVVGIASSEDEARRMRRAFDAIVAPPHLIKEPV